MSGKRNKINYLYFILRIFCIDPYQINIFYFLVCLFLPMHGHFRHSALPIPAYRNKHFAADDNEMGSDQSAVRSSFGCVLLLNEIYLTTMCCSTMPFRLVYHVYTIKQKDEKSKTKKNHEQFRKWSYKSVRSVRKGEGDYGGKDLSKR